MRFYFSILLLFIFGDAISQNDTTNLSEVLVNVSFRDDFNIGASTQTLDKSVLNQYSSNDLGDVLARESNIFIKTYGPSNLGTSSVRGASAAHTKVLWNGFDISNPMLGQVDFSYLQAGQFDEIELQMGNTAGLYGGGTQGGVIHLKNQQKFNDGDRISLGLTSNSIGMIAKNVNFKTSTRNVISSINVAHTSAENNFKYFQHYEYDGNKLIGFGDVLRRQNANSENIGLSINNYFRIGNYAILSIGNWYQQNERGTADNYLVSNSDAKLYNESLRNTLSYKYAGNKFDFRTSGAFFNEKLNFNDHSKNITSDSEFSKIIGATELNYRLTNRIESVLGVNLMSEKVVNNGFSETRNRLTSAFFTALKSNWIDDKLTTSTSIRIENVNGKIQPFTGSFGIDYSIFNNWNFSTSLSKNYRIPTFNDLYYIGFGNPNLNPERGWSSEIATKYGKEEKWVKTTAFYSDYTDWINWQPDSTGVFTPQNNDVFTRGAEVSIYQKLNKFHLRGNYSYTESINKITGNQLIFVPKHKFNAVLEYDYKSNSVSLQQQFVGARHISSDNKSSLPRFNLFSLRLNKTFKAATGNVICGFNIENLLNVNYQTQVGYPMPRRYYELSFKMIFNNNDKIKNNEDKLL